MFLATGDALSILYSADFGSGSAALVSRSMLPTDNLNLAELDSEMLFNVQTRRAVLAREGSDVLHGNS